MSNSLLAVLSSPKPPDLLWKIPHSAFHFLPASHISISQFCPPLHPHYHPLLPVIKYYVIKTAVSKTFRISLLQVVFFLLLLLLKWLENHRALKYLWQPWIRSGFFACHSLPPNSLTTLFIVHTYGTLPNLSIGLFESNKYGTQLWLFPAFLGWYLTY